MVTDSGYLRALGIRDAGRLTAGEVWTALCERSGSSVGPELAVILREGCLAKRVLRALGVGPGSTREIARSELEGVYGRLCGCLADGRMFRF